MPEDIDVTRIAGNAPDHVKSFLADTSFFYEYAHTLDGVTGPIFGESIMKRIVVTEVSVEKKAEEPRKLEGRVVCEVTVEDDMINGGGNIHGGCSAFLIDVCSTMALMALSMTDKGEAHRSVSQSLNVVYHSPAGLGDKLRLVNTTITLGGRAQSARTEIWNVTHHRLVSSGVHIKMQPSSPKANL
ncbi:putative thioesterase superfamily protein [Lyophyllum shimeji]|uniref:Thioesterase superfamily protein n=1 Tax=Lyophyllum shimeji TaxID=47721 RepID=A0A9P3UKA3_LYOSH|nr:putative thioesterase superfamily protein [Lyophyllum shimeji]